MGGVIIWMWVKSHLYVSHGIDGSDSSGWDEAPLAFLMGLMVLIALDGTKHPLRCYHAENAFNNWMYSPPQYKH